MKLKEMSTGLVITLIFFILIGLNNVLYAKGGESLKKGDYIKFGHYNEEEILWRVIKEDDENHRVKLVTDRIITLKAFDASGENDGYGNNDWNKSNIRDWLNSESTPKLSDDEWTHEKPIHSHVNCNDYPNEAGFLSNFLEKERSIIVRMRDEEANDEKSDLVTLLTKDDLSLLIEAGYSDCATQPTKKAIENNDYEHVDLAEDRNWWYWTKTPDLSKDNILYIVNYAGTLNTRFPYQGTHGVRPTLWINTEVLELNDATGITKEDAYNILNYDTIIPQIGFRPSSDYICKGMCMMHINPSDKGTGVDYYKRSLSIDGGITYGEESIFYNGVPKLMKLYDGINKVKIEIYDKAGNSNIVYSSLITVDNTKPTKPVISYTPEDITNLDIEISIQYSDDSKVKQYKINDGDYKNYNDSFVISENCTIVARGQDEAGNYSEEEKCIINNIDKNLIDDAKFIVSTTELTNKNIVVTINYGENVTIKEYKIGENGDFRSYNNPIEVVENCTIYARGYNSEGKESNVTSLTITNIDKIGPNKPIISKESGLYKEEIEVEILKGDDETQQIYYTLDGGIPRKISKQYNGKMKIDGMPSEEVVLKAVAYDNLGNTSNIAEKYYRFSSDIINMQNINKKNFKYYLGINKYGLIKVMLVSKNGKDLEFNRNDVIEVEGDNIGCFKEGIMYIDRDGMFKKFR